MGKSLIIKGADFSENAVTPNKMNTIRLGLYNSGTMDFTANGSATSGGTINNWRASNLMPVTAGQVVSVSLKKGGRVQMANASGVVNYNQILESGTFTLTPTVNGYIYINFKLAGAYPDSAAPVNTVKDIESTYVK